MHLPVLIILFAGLSHCELITVEHVQIRLCDCVHVLLVQVNAQVLASTFTQESQQRIKLGEAVGAVLQSCSASKKPLSHVQVSTYGKKKKTGLTRFCNLWSKMGGSVPRRKKCET